MVRVRGWVVYYAYASPHKDRKTVMYSVCVLEIFVRGKIRFLGISVDRKLHYDIREGSHTNGEKTRNREKGERRRDGDVWWEGGRRVRGVQGEMKE